MSNPSPDAVASVYEPVAVLSGAGSISVRLVGEAGQDLTLRMAEASALLLAALLAAAGPAAAGATAA
jgi:hypothetical protein